MLANRTLMRISPGVIVANVIDLQEEFEATRSSLITNAQRPDIQLGEEAERFWGMYACLGVNMYACMACIHSMHGMSIMFACITSVMSLA